MAHNSILNTALAKTEAKYLRGCDEYGRQMDDAQIPLIDWIRALQEEAIDTVFYCEKIIREIEGEKS